jgi:hypothetical protein
VLEMDIRLDSHVAVTAEDAKIRPVCHVFGDYKRVDTPPGNILLHPVAEISA